MAAPMRQKVSSVFKSVFSNLLCDKCNASLSEICSRNFHSTCSLHRDGSSGMKGRKLSSQLWLKRQMDDPYVKRARLKSYRCRSAFKLIEIDDKYKVLKPGDFVIDCGAAPGSWTQVVVEKTREAEIKGSQSMNSSRPNVIAIDILGFAPVDGAKIFSSCDFTLPENQKNILQYLQGHQVDTVLSDMAPNATGHKAMDHENIIELCRSVLRFSRAVLRPGGTMLCKIWQGGQDSVLTQEIKEFFKSVKNVKPNASRMDSAETYVLSRGYKGLSN